MSENKVRRKKYLIHPSSQFKYIIMTVLPALIMGLFCTHFLIKTGEIIFRVEKNQLKYDISTINRTVVKLQTDSYPQEMAEIVLLKDKVREVFKINLADYK